MDKRMREDWEAYCTGRWQCTNDIGMTFLVEQVGENDAIGWLVDVDWSIFYDALKDQADALMSETATVQEMMTLGRHYLSLSYNNIPVNRLPEFDGTDEDFYQLGSPINSTYGV